MPGDSNFGKGFIFSVKDAQEAAQAEKPLRDAARIDGIDYNTAKALDAMAVEKGKEVSDSAEKANNLLFCLDEVSSDISHVSELIERIHKITSTDERREEMEMMSMSSYELEKIQRVIFWLEKFRKAMNFKGVEPELKKVIAGL